MVVVVAYDPDECIPDGRCALMCNGNIEWINTRYLDATLVGNEFPSYVEVSQHNYCEKNKNGSCSLYHKMPKDVAEAKLWAYSMGGIRFLDVAHCGFGCGLYKVNQNLGTLEFFNGHWDSSG
jgi:hypothetical protein